MSKYEDIDRGQMSTTPRQPANEALPHYVWGGGGSAGYEVGDSTNAQLVKGELVSPLVVDEEAARLARLGDYDIEDMVRYLLRKYF